MQFGNSTLQNTIIIKQNNTEMKVTLVIILLTEN
jgi:hypothetical protein